MVGSRACKAKTKGEGVRNAEQDSQRVEVSRGSNQNKDICLCNKQRIWKKNTQKKQRQRHENDFPLLSKTLQYVSFPCKLSHNNEDE